MKYPTYSTNHQSKKNQHHMDTMTETIVLALTALTMVLSCISVLLCALVFYLMKKLLQGNAATTAAVENLAKRAEAAIEELQKSCSHRPAAGTAEETVTPKGTLICDLRAGSVQTDNTVSSDESIITVLRAP